MGGEGGGSNGGGCGNGEGGGKQGDGGGGGGGHGGGEKVSQSTGVSQKGMSGRDETSEGAVHGAAHRPHEGGRVLVFRHAESFGVAQNAKRRKMAKHTVYSSTCGSAVPSRVGYIPRYASRTNGCLQRFSTASRERDALLEGILKPTAAAVNKGEV